MKVTTSCRVRYDIDKFTSKLKILYNDFYIRDTDSHIEIYRFTNKCTTKISYTYKEVHKLLGLPKEKELVGCDKWAKDYNFFQFMWRTFTFSCYPKEIVLWLREDKTLK